MNFLHFSMKTCCVKEILISDHSNEYTTCFYEEIEPYLFAHMKYGSI